MSASSRSSCVGTTSAGVAFGKLSGSLGDIGVSSLDHLVTVGRAYFVCGPCVCKRAAGGSVVGTWGPAFRFGGMSVGLLI
jgi:hypothetical protein